VRRAIPALIVTLIGLVALATFKSTPTVVKSANASTPKATVPPATAPPTGEGATEPTTPATGAPQTQPTTGTGGGSRTVDGDPVDNRYGTVQVRVMLRGRRIAAVTALQMPFDRMRSQYISQQAEPYLRQETLQAQSAHIDLVSGATFTSESYAQSLQSALDKAGI
jgi:uncharacterized protein with FMN-binding domain